MSLRVVPEEHSLSSVKPCPVCNDTGCHIATRVYPPMSLQDIPVSLEVGKSYTFHAPGKREHRWTYRLIGDGLHVHSHQNLVAYVGLDHADKGKIFFSPLTDWHVHFKLTREPEPESEPITLDLRESGNPH